MLQIEPLHHFYSSQNKTLKLMMNMSIKKTLEILVLELMYPNNGDKWDLILIILVKGPTKILKTLLNQFLMVLL